MPRQDDLVRPIWSPENVVRRTVPHGPALSDKPDLDQPATRLDLTHYSPDDFAQIYAPARLTSNYGANICATLPSTTLPVPLPRRGRFGSALRTVRPKYACRAYEGSVVQAPAPARMDGKEHDATKTTDGFVAKEEALIATLKKVAAGSPLRF